MKQLKIEDFLNYRYLGSLKANPSKTHAAFVISQARYDDNDYIHSLFLFDGTQSKRVLDLDTDARFYWEQDDTILFHHTTGSQETEAVSQKKSIIYRYHIITGIIEPAYTFPIAIGSLKVLQNGNLLITAHLNVDDHILFDTEKRNDYLAKIKKDTNYEVFDSVPFYANGGGFTKAKIGQAFIYNTKEETYHAVAEKNVDIALAHFDEATQIAYFYKEIPNGLPQFYADIIGFNTQTQDIIESFKNDTYMISNMTVLDGQIYVFASTGKAFGINQNSDVYRLDNDDLVRVCEFGRSSWNSVGSDVRFLGSAQEHVINNNFYFVGTYQDRTVLYCFDGQTIETVFSPEGSIDGWIQLNDQFFGIGLFDNRHQELYAFNFDESTYSRLTSFNAEYWDNHYLATPQHIQYESNGDMLDGWVLLPQDYDAKKQYPAILDIHGGPKTIYNGVVYHEMQAWANLGYIVFFTNPHGGDVYGNEFADIRGKYGTIDYADIMTFTDLVLDRYAIDRARVGVTGGSYGGFMTNWIVSHTDRFAAAATQRSISNWISFYGTSDIGVYFGPDQTGGSPFENLEAAWEQSPLKHAHAIKTPLLFIHSEEDYRCPIEQAMQLFTAVKQNGVETRFVWIRGENHDLSRSGRPQSRLKRLQEITTWMDTYL